jgi:hypothetical protein
MSTTSLIVDLKIGRERNLLWDLLRRLRDAGKKVRVTVSEYRKRRTDRQNRFYWPCFVVPFAEWLRAQEQTGPLGSLITDQEAHELLKFRFLRVTKYNPKTGEVLGDLVGSTTDLSTAGFNEYLDRCNNWLSKYCGFPHIEPKHYHEREEEKARRRKTVQSRTVTRKALPEAK